VGDVPTERNAKNGRIKTGNKILDLGASARAKSIGSPEANSMYVSIGGHRSGSLLITLPYDEILLFLFRQLLARPVGELGGVIRARKSERLPVVMSRNGACAVLAKLLYGMGMRLMEYLEFRVQDIDFPRHEILVRKGKGVPGHDIPPLVGGLGVSKEAPVGFQKIRLEFELETDASEEQLQTLLRLTERYCVVFQTLAKSPQLSISQRSAPQE
jgi:hypothetical protein